MAGGVRPGGRLSYAGHSQYWAGRSDCADVLHGAAQRRYLDTGGMEALASVEYAGLSLYLAALLRVVWQPLHSRRLLAHYGVPAPLLRHLRVRAVRLLLCAR